MVKHTSFVALGLTALSLAACQTSAPTGGLASADTSQPEQKAGPQDAALTFSQAACGGCHAVEYPGASPNPNSPTFAAIANREGVSDETLAEWLANAHNYPEVMDFDLTAEQVELIAQHMRTLRRDDYRPEI